MSGIERMLGPWALVTQHRFKNGVFNRDTMGVGTRGRIIYDAGGTMAAFLMAADWSDGHKEPSWDVFLSYSARWELRDAETVVHTVDFCSVPDLIGRDLVRTISWQGDGTLKLVTDGHTTRDGVKTHDELLWRRED